LALTIYTTNTSETDTIQGIWYEPFILKFPSKLKEYDGSIPLLVHSVGDVAAVKVSYDTGTLVVVNEDVDKPLMLGLPWANNRPTSTVFPLSLHTDRVDSYPDSFPVINRPLAPKATDEYHVSLRFGRAGANEVSLASDVYKKFGEKFPPRVSWNDRRAIGAIFLASSSQNWRNNPRGWLGDQLLNIETPAGRTSFKQRILQRADDSIAIMKEMGAQGVITWDIEGQEYAHATSYIGDPRKMNEMAPEMAEIADEYFGRFRNAGLRVGICVRPQQLVVAPDRKSATQVTVDDPAQLLIDKIRYAKNRWGISLAYIDSNTNLKDPNPMPAAALQKVADAFPDVLLIPEHSNLQYYSFSAPFRALQQGYVSTPETARTTYPNALTIIYTADGPLDLYNKSLARAVKHGDVLLYRTWYADPQNEKVKLLLKR
jgi:hypothetical protein